MCNDKWGTEVLENPLLIFSGLVLVSVAQLHWSIFVARRVGLVMWK